MKSFKEYISEASFKIDMPDMPAVYVDAKSAGEVKKKLRALLKKPMDVEVSRVNPAKVKKAFRLRAQGKDEDEEEVKEGKQKPYVSSDRDGIHVMNGSGKVAKSFGRQDRDKAQAYLKKHYNKLMKEEAELDEKKLSLKDFKRGMFVITKKGEVGKIVANEPRADQVVVKMNRTKKEVEMNWRKLGLYTEPRLKGLVQAEAYSFPRRRPGLKDFKKGTTKTKTKTKEALDKQDEPKVKEIIKKLKGASKAHAGQAKDLEKAVSEKRGRPRKDGTADGDLENIQMQLRKSVSLRGKKDVEFADGKKKKVNDKVAQKVLQLIDKYRQSKDKQNIVNYIGKSEKNLMNFASGKAKMDDMDPEAKRKKLLGIK